jgi:hypothetical protein
VGVTRPAADKQGNLPDGRFVACAERMHVGKGEAGDAGAAAAQAVPAALERPTAVAETPAPTGEMASMARRVKAEASQ